MPVTVSGRVAAHLEILVVQLQGDFASLGARGEMEFSQVGALAEAAAFGDGCGCDFLGVMMAFAADSQAPVLADLRARQLQVSIGDEHFDKPAVLVATGAGFDAIAFRRLSPFLESCMNLMH